jgi:hypothetical protein
MGRAWERLPLRKRRRSQRFAPERRREFLAAKAPALVAGLAASEQTQSAAVEEAADGGPSGTLGDTNTAGELSNGEADAWPAFQPADWSPDGKWVYIAHGEVRSDAVLISNFR